MANSFGSGREPGVTPSRVRGVTDTPAAAAIATLYAVAYPRLVALLAAIGGSASDAEEIAQDAFVQLLGHWDRVREYDDPQAWVRSVAVRRLISHRRRAAVAARGLLRLGGWETPRSESAGGEVERALDLEAALDRVSPTLRAPLILHYVADLPVERIAAELQIPVGTVKSRLSRARAALAPLLTDGEEIHRA